MSYVESDWELEDFTSSTVIGGTEILLTQDGSKAIIVYPWHSRPSDSSPVWGTVRGMGFTIITEVGNLQPYTVPGADTDDSDYVLMEAE